MQNYLGKKLVDHVHHILVQSNVSQLCERYDLKEVTSLIKYDYTESRNTYQVSVKTTFSAHFETFVVYDENNGSVDFGKVNCEMSSSSGDINRFSEQKDSGSGSGSYQRHPMASMLGSRSSPPLDSGRSRQSPSMSKLIAQNHQFVPQSSSVTMPNLPSRIDNQGDGRASNVSSLLIRASMNIKCYCSKQETRADFMVICENCHTWQHGLCVGIYETLSTPYLCKSCRPSGFPRRWIKSVDDSLLVNEFIKATRLWPQLFTKRAFQGGFKLKHNVGCTEDTVLVKLKEQMKDFLLNADLDVGTRIRLHFHARIPPTDELKEFLNARGYLRVDIRGAMTAFYSRADEIFDFPPKIDIQQLPWFPMKCEANLMAPITVQGSHPPGIMTSSQPKQPRPSQTVPRAPMDSHPTHPLPNVVMNGMTPPSGQTMNNAEDFHQMSIGDFFRMTRATPTGPMATQTLSKNDHQQQIAQQNSMGSNRDCDQSMSISASHVPSTSQVNHRNTVSAQMQPAISRVPDPMNHSHRYQDRDRSRDSAKTTLSKNDHQQQTTRQDPGASSRYRYQPTTISASHVPSTSQDFTQIQPAVGHGSNPTSHSHRYQDLHHSRGSSNTIPRPASFSPPGHRHHPTSILTTNVPSTSQGGTVSAQMPPAISRVPDPMSHSHRYQDRDRSRDSAFTGSTSLSPPAQVPQCYPPTLDPKGPSSKNLDSIGRPIKKELDDKEASLEFQRNAKRIKKEKEAMSHSNPKLTTGQFLGQLEVFLHSLGTGNTRIVDFINQVRLRREGQNEFQRDEITYAEIYSHLKSIFKTMRNHTQKIRPSEPETELEIVFDPLWMPLKKFLEKLNAFVGTFKMYYGDFQKLEEEIRNFASGVSEDLVIEVETIPQRLNWIYDQYGLI
ncbi:hypothetical protein B9Z55_018111 [Caenorhabditis nigoni]|uniref:Zinc finger PHD-type domain-containing protein n=2 Tax=Caenorhabditis nigoni TaxID=1611254 RepID=A0A2G5TCM3_9PELO|nr:hypothetical protein B9Z55_018111 [Caenorhabditis nigoni]